MTRRQRLLRWVYVILWMAVIYFLSSRPDLHSGLQPTWDFILRKIAHAIEYGMLATLIARACAREALRRRDVVIGVIIASFYAVTDEYHQTFIAGRHGSPIDWLIDTLGACVFAAVLWRVLDARRRAS